MKLKQASFLLEKITDEKFSKVSYRNVEVSCMVDYFSGCYNNGIGDTRRLKPVWSGHLEKNS